MEIAWDDKFNTGVERIDFEHRIFLDLIKSLDQGLKAGRSRAQLARTLDEILHYARFHFVSEENLMLDVGFPDYEHHRQEHQRLLAMLADRAHDFNRDGSADGEEIVEFLFQWFALHTTQADQEIARHLRAGG